MSQTGHAEKAPSIPAKLTGNRTPVGASGASAGKGVSAVLTSTGTVIVTGIGLGIVSANLG